MTLSRFDHIISQSHQYPPLKTAIVHPVEPNGLNGALDAAEKGIIAPVLIGPAQRIQVQAKKLQRDISQYPIIDTAHSHAAAEKAVQLASKGTVSALMKGDLASAELLSAILNKASGLRIERRLSHAFLLDIPRYHKPLVITDAAINVTPDLQVKADILQNAIDLCLSLGITTPKAAILAAIEKVKPGMPSTIDAAALCKMADRHQIHGAIVDGPLAFDNAISLQAARDKHIQSPVSGDADILLAPDLEAANMLAKQLIYLANARSAGLVLGASVPIVLNSRADGSDARLASCALAALTVQHKHQSLTEILTDS
ncbi:bifunctional enoyl-CoA hydratase/phosphate acetyltransferase [Aliamphritea ceti]|uniref:bifunctional enoyl-CoA hydratase/phosphate acetyltransferase n=1 Tax=Aliamphritea ceti TaxID=1524258 RepID=UPI0021C49451|nr:bifunctional enoyl-CoA hydratase/phosphate acetyltransferase [Aliamphritea ceti]